MATCCHHLSRLEYLNNLAYYLERLKLTCKETVLLFKSTSWIFGPIDIHQEHMSNELVRSTKIFEQKGIKKSYFGLIAKYIIDLCRCLALVEKGFHTYYVKYCDNEITTENNLILALSKSK
jgi:hypothetical protein